MKPPRAANSTTNSIDDISLPNLISTLALAVSVPAILWISS